MVERYPNLKEEVGGSILVVKSPLYLIEHFPSGQLPLVLWRQHVGLLSQKKKKKKNDCVCRVFTCILYMHQIVLGYKYGFCPTCALLLGTKYNERKKEDDSNVATSVNHHVASILSLSKLVFNPEMDIRKVGGPLMTTLSFQRWSP